MSRAGSVVIRMVVRGVVMRCGRVPGWTRAMIVRRRSVRFVTGEGQAKLRGDCGHDLHWYRQREYRHQKQTHPNHAAPPGQQERSMPPRRNG
jgi:hypothetical protein